MKRPCYSSISLTRYRPQPNSQGWINLLFLSLFSQPLAHILSVVVLTCWIALWQGSGNGDDNGGLCGRDTDVVNYSTSRSVSNPTMWIILQNSSHVRKKMIHKCKIRQTLQFPTAYHCFRHDSLGVKVIQLSHCILMKCRNKQLKRHYGKLLM